MPEIHGHITAVRQDVLGDETTAAAIATDTVLYVADTVDFAEEGGHVRINGTVYEYLTMDEGDVSGTPSITLATGLTDPVDAETWLELWDPSANNGVGSTVVEWKVDVASDDGAGSGVAVVSHALIGLLPAGMPVGIGASVTVRADEDGSWTVIDVHGARPGYDPQYFRTGVLEADVSITAGDPTGKRVVMNAADGSPAFEAYDASSNQTVNIDGVANYMEGTLATAASGARVEIGAGSAGSQPTNEARLHSGHADETSPAKLEGFVNGAAGAIRLRSPELSTSAARARIEASSSAAGSQVELEANSFSFVDGDVAMDGGLSVANSIDATMGDGSVGTGTFRDSVDARVTAVAPGAVPAASETVQGKAELATQAEVNTGADDARIVTPLKMATRLAAAYQPLDTELSAIAGLTSAADRLPYFTGSGTAALATFTSTARNLLNDTSATEMRATILARALRLTTTTISASGAYTIALADELTQLQFTSGSAVTIEIPLDATLDHVTNAVYNIIRLGAGTVTITPAVGVTLNGKTSTSALASAVVTRYGGVQLWKRAADLWLITGDFT